MNCAADSTELTIIEEDASTTTIENNTIEIAPQGCKPVSEDVCKSGFMASAEDVTFPENPLDQCCKCKEGELCSYCENKYACTEEENNLFTAESGCFGDAEPAAGPSTDQAPEDLDNFFMDLWNNYKYIFIGLLLIIVLIVLGLIASRSKTI